MDIYYMNISCLMNIEKIELYKRKLSEYRVAKIDKCKLIKNKAQSLGAGLLLSELLRERGIDESLVRYSENEHGKPYMPDYKDIYFSISHSDYMVSVMLDDNPCGIDIEHTRDFSQAVVKRIFNEHDKKLIENVMNYDKIEAQYIFTEIWTRKEAIGKLSGKGLDFTDDFQLNELDNEYLEKNNIYVRTDRMEDGFVVSAASGCPDIKKISPVKIVLKK
ncbi:MAG: 4'-phosphopantetheinyl transferase family protein [Coprococcus sp.]